MLFAFLSFSFRVLSLMLSYCGGSVLAVLTASPSPLMPQELLDLHFMHTASRSKQGVKVRFYQQPQWALAAPLGSSHCFNTIPQDTCKDGGGQENSIVGQGFSGGQARPYEQVRGSRPIPSLPLVVSDSVALCTKAVAGAAGWLLNE